MAMPIFSRYEDRIDPREWLCNRKDNLSDIGSIPEYLDDKARKWFYENEYPFEKFHKKLQTIWLEERNIDTP